MNYPLINWSFVIEDQKKSTEIENIIKKGGLLSSLGLDLKPFKIPGTLQSNLTENNNLNPYYEKNMDYFKKYETENLLLFCEFDFSEDLLDPIQLNFDYIDTMSKIYLNGDLIGKSDNYFIPHSFSLGIKQFYKENNLLTLIITSPLAFVDKSINLPEILDRVFIRRPAYNYGWDFAPRSILMGIGNVYYKQISKIELYDLYISTEIIGESEAKFTIEFSLNSNTVTKLNLVINLLSSNSDLVYSTTKKMRIAIKNYQEKITFTIRNVDFWWPNGYGDQPLYTLEIKEKMYNINISKKCGIRSIKLLLEENSKSQFTFIVNGKKIWIKGANWVPTDALTNYSSHEKYNKLLELAVNCNFNMLRIWGGGVVEDNHFYNLCDELGIMIWHDFQFACSIYPENDSYLSNVKKELIFIIKKLRNHPSIVLWCGNNENEWIYFQRYPEEYNNGLGIGHKINQLKEQICNEYDPSRPFWRSSPWSTNEDDPNSFNSGNSHDWFVWHGLGFKIPPNYTEYINNSSKFITEFGIQSFPVKGTIDKIFSDKTQSDINEIWEFHNIVLDKIKINMDLFGTPSNINEWIMISQLAQSMGLKFAIETWRSQKFNTSGSLIWQFNEPWPTICWSIVDYFLVPKMSYYYVRRAYSSILPIFNRSKRKIMIVNDLMKSIEGILVIKCYKFKEGLINEINQKIVIPENNTGEFMLENSILSDLDYILLEFNYKDELFENIYFLCEDQEIINLNLPQSNIVVEFDKENMFLEFKSNDFVFIIQIPPELEPEDNYISLVPDSPKIVKINNLPTDSSISFFTWSNELKNTTLFWR